MAKSEKLPLSPMLFQYLVGLYTLEHGSGVQYNVTLGDLVMDEASGTLRDVDVTVTTPDGMEHKFVGYEVKHWKKNLDVSHVEALATKLKDMPTVTQRAIVCSSGYTEPAIKKAEHHGIDLYVIKEWTTPVEAQFPDIAPMKGPPAEIFRGSQSYLTWPEHSLWLHVDGPLFDIAWGTPLFGLIGKQHPVFPNFGTFSDGMLEASTGTLCVTKPMRDRLEPQLEALKSGESIPEGDLRWPFGHTLEIASAEVYIRTPDDALRRMDAVTIQGQLPWETSPWLNFAMEKVPTGEMFASALVGVSPIPGRMFALMIPIKGRNLSTRHIRLQKDQLNAITQLEIALSKDNSSE